MKTQFQKDCALQQLKIEYTKRSHEIGRRKQELEIDRHLALMEIDNEFHKKRRELLSSLSKLRDELSIIPENDIKTNILRNKIRSKEHTLSIIKEEYTMKIRETCNGAYVTRCSLDDSSRQLTEWYEEERLKIMVS